MPALLRTRIILVLTLVGIVVAVGGSGVLNPRAAIVVDDLAQLIGGFAAVATCWITARSRVGPERRWRILMGAGMLGWSLGMVVWALYRSVFRAPLPAASIADIGFFVFPVLAVSALLSMIGRTPSRRAVGETHGWTMAVLDGLVIVGSLFVLSWTTALGAVVHSGSSTTLGFLVSIMYPITDFVLVGMVALLAVVPRTMSRNRYQLILLGLGMIALAGSDTAYAYLVSVGTEVMPPIADAGFIAGPAFIALAATVPSRRSALWVRNGPSWRSERTQLLIPHVLMLAIGLVVAVRWFTLGSLDGVVVTACIVVVLLALARQVFTLVENDALLRKVSAARDELSYRANFDGLTGLANRTSFDDNLLTVIESYRVGGHHAALLLIDLDDFKAVNDGLGHASGDKVLVIAAERIRLAAGPDAHVARFGGDEFTVIVRSGVEDTTRLADAIVDAMAFPTDVDGHPVSIGASIGVVEFASVAGELTPDSLLRCADRAMYQAKRHGKGAARLFGADQRRRGTSPYIVAGEPDPARLIGPPTRT